MDDKTLEEKLAEMWWYKYPSDDLLVGELKGCDIPLYSQSTGKTLIYCLRQEKYVLKYCKRRNVPSS